MKIAKVESFHIVADRAAHMAAAGRPTVDRGRRRTSATPGVKALDYNAGRHLCAYPAMDETLLVRLTSDTGLVGWGEAHSPPVPGVAKAVIADLFAPLLLGQDPLAIEVLWDQLYASMRLRGHGAGFQLEGARRD